MIVKDSNIKLTYPSKMEGIDFSPYNYFPSHFLSLIIGKPGYGKTSLLKTMLKEEKILFKKFDYIFILSPSPVEYVDLFLPKENISENFNLNWLFEKIKYIDDNAKFEYVNVLVILDDFVADIKDNETNIQLKRLLFNRRHLITNGMVSVIITSQKFKSIPSIVRAIINHLIFFRLNPSEEDVIKEDCVHDNLDFKSILEFTFDSPKSFMIYNMTDSKIFKNFDEIIIQPQNIK